MNNANTLGADAIAESILDQKFSDSYRQIQKERKLNRFSGTLEALFFIGLLVAFLSSIKFVFWGAGFSFFATEQHNFTVNFLSQQPGPQAQMVRDTMDRKGHVSLFEYHKYVTLANEHKASSLK
ncbi:MAG: hypothetical protein K6L81_03560 [Agarilytica sp.]